MQDETSLVVHLVSTRNPESLTRTRVETISNYDLRLENLLGSMSDLCSSWIKQHLRIKRFFGTSENAVKTQIWTAISIYVLVAIVKKRLKLPRSLS